MAPASKQGEGEPLSSARIRQSFLDFFRAHGHEIVPSASLVPGSDETLLFTNAGMVQFKDVFLGTGSRPYKRAADAQKCMRVAGKHNDLDDVGRDDTHHTFFEMLGNWSFGDYYKEEAISWAWTLLTEQWGLPKDQLYATCFEDELGEIPKDEEAAEIWRQQPGFKPDHVIFFGRDENFWEMAETGPCGPDSEIHLDRGEGYCDRAGENGHQCRVNGDCQRFLELWNLVFIQYNRQGPNDLSPLPAKHVDTGMGFERLVSVLQDVDSNYKTDLFTPLLNRVQELAGHSDEERASLLTPYRVIADHGRAATFLIGDGVVPGNTGRNYVCRMIIRRASRFGSYAGFEEPFLAEIAKVVMREYGDFYPEIRRNEKAILRTITEEERRFQRTVEEGVEQLERKLSDLEGRGISKLPGEEAFELYATFGLPFEITRDIAREAGLEVAEEGFRQAMDTHRKVSSAGEGEERLAAADASFYRGLREDLIGGGKLEEGGVAHDPYGVLERPTEVLALIRDGEIQEHVGADGQVEVLLPATPFYRESGGQIDDTGTIVAADDGDWEIEVESIRQPVGGLLLHVGRVVKGKPASGDRALARVDRERRFDIMRNHTATHLLHAALHRVLGEHARQAGSLVAADRLRFDFTHPEAMTADEIERVERWVNEAILANYPLTFRHQPREEAIESGAIALFGETYGQEVRTVTIGTDRVISYELCGGTHVAETGVIGPFLILSEGSAAAGIRRIEAITGRKAYERIRRWRQERRQLAGALGTSPVELEARVLAMQKETRVLEDKLAAARSRLAHQSFEALEPAQISDVPVIAAVLPDTPAEVLRELCDRFRNEVGSGVIVLASAPRDEPIFVAAVSQDLVERGLHAGQLIGHVAEAVGGGGGGRPTMAQAGGKDPARISEALDRVPGWIEDHLG